MRPSNGTFPRPREVAAVQHAAGDGPRRRHPLRPRRKREDARRHCASLDEALEIFSGDPLLFRSGTEYRYSTYDWILVSAVVEAARESPFSRS
jgi:hypothetical protein